MSDRQDSLILHSSSENDSSGTDSDCEEEIKIRWVTPSANQMLTRVLSRKGSNKKDKDRLSSTEQAIPSDQSKKIRELRERLKEKEKLLYQLEQQEKEFLGIDNQSQDTTMFRIEFKTTMSKDYYLIKGCPETFIPAGKSVTIFGQLQNKRWRCVVEDADYANNVRSSNELFDPFVDEKKDTRTCDVSRNIVQEKKDSRFLPCYPLIGSLPSSVIADFNDRMNLENDDSKALYSKDHDIDGDIEDTSIDIDHSDIVLCECGRRLPSSHDVPPRLPSCSFCQYCTFPSPIQTITPEHLEQLNLQRFPSMSAAHLPTLPESPTESTIAELNMALESLAKLRPRSRPASSGSDGSCRNSWTYR